VSKSTVFQPKGWRTGYLNRVEERRGKKAADELRAEVMRQWASQREGK
jgi:hypothetical protein